MNRFLFLLTCLTMSLPAMAQNGTVNSFVKISQTQAGFPITLNNGDNFGQAVTCIGDLNQDGTNDLAITQENGTYDGIVYITFLDSNGFVSSFVEIKQGLFGLPTNQDYNMKYFGISVDTIGDLNHDGIVDLIVGMPYISGGNEKGYVFILFMNINGTVNSYTMIGENLNGFNEGLSYTKFGKSVAGIGDINSDGYYDIAVGGTEKDNGAGAIWILNLNMNGSVIGKTRLDKNTPALLTYFNLSSSTAYSFGTSITYLGDLDNDNSSDICVGSINFSHDYGDGSAAIIFLNANGTIKDFKPIHPGLSNFNDTINPVSGFGKSITSINDINGDQISDIAISSPWYSDSQCSQCGAVWILMLDTLGDVIDYQRISDSDGNFSGHLSSNDLFGGSMSGIGDFNGDLIADIVISAKRDDDGGGDRGAVYILNLNGVPDSTYYMGIKEEHNEMALYPNPANEMLTIDLGRNPDGFYKCQLYNMQGCLAKESSISPGDVSVRINTSNLPCGIYMVRISGKSKVFTRKVVVSR